MYIFYLRTAFVDIENLNAKIPIFEDSIYIKVLKLPSGIYSKQKNYNSNKTN
jgi:hypothetical protein